ncbi:MAG: hypothetical protein IPO02_07335 [Bacteroidetes bacterium]|nr:hypothetical protein [Bacteroidota bacterium]
MFKWGVKIVLLISIGMLPFVTIYACSMYKLTIDGKTMVGNNEDSWGMDARIWFEKSTQNQFGAVYVGYRRNEKPDGAMNEYGLVFDAFTMPHKSNIHDKDTTKKDFAYNHLKKIMQQCKTVDEVYIFLNNLNLHILNGSPLFNGGMLLFADKSGKYLVVEANKMTLGNDDTFLLANFSVADTKDLSTIKIERYCKGLDFLKNKKVENNLAFCTALSDTMSVHRSKIGDGTLYTTIYDIENGLIHTYFFHDYNRRITFNLKDELAKGNHSLNFDELFPDNTNYHRFVQYKTPQNFKPFFIFILLGGMLFFFSSIYFFIQFLKSLRHQVNFVKLGFTVLNFALCLLSYVLIRNQSIFYFPSPYYDSHSVIATTASYLPYLLVLIIIPLILYIFHLFRHMKWNTFARYLLLVNTLVYILFIGLSIYWKMFHFIL